MAQFAPMALSAVGSVIGGLTGGKGAAKAAKIQGETTDKIIAANDRGRAQITGLEQPTIDRGNAAGDLFGNFVGLNGGTGAADALAQFRASTGYGDLLKQGLGAVNANAYARGAGDSGATYKALQDRGMGIADQSSNEWLSRLNTLMNLGQGGVGTVAGAITHATDSNNASTQTLGDAQGNAALVSSSAWQKALQGLFNSGSSALGSSYGGSSSSGAGSVLGAGSQALGWGF